jgi:hypothetical protein
MKRNVSLNVKPNMLITNPDSVFHHVLVHLMPTPSTEYASFSALTTILAGMVIELASLTVRMAPMLTLIYESVFHSAQFTLFSMQMIELTNACKFVMESLLILKHGNV